MHEHWLKSRCEECGERVQINTLGAWIHARYPAEDGHEAKPNEAAVWYARRGLI